MRGGEDMWTVITFREGSRVRGRSTPHRQLLECTLQIALCPSELLVTTNACNALSCLWMEIYPAKAIYYISLKIEGLKGFLIYEHSGVIHKLIMGKCLLY